MVATFARWCARPAGDESRLQVGGVVGKRARLVSRASEGHTESIFFECSAAAPVSRSQPLLYQDSWPGIAGCWPAARVIKTVLSPPRSSCLRRVPTANPGSAWELEGDPQ